MTELLTLINLVTLILNLALFYHLLKRQKQTDQIQQEALKESQKIISENTIISREVSDNIEEEFKKKAGQSFDLLDQAYKQKISEAVKGWLERLNQTSLSIESETRQQFINQSASLNKILDQLAAKEFETIKLEIEGYKKKEVELMEQKIQSKVQELSLKILGQSISLAEHHKLIAKALEKARQEGVFENL